MGCFEQTPLLVSKLPYRKVFVNGKIGVFSNGEAMPAGRGLDRGLRVRDQFLTAIAGARGRNLDAIAQQMWVAHGNGLLPDDDAQALAEAIEQRRRPGGPGTPQNALQALQGRRQSIFPPRRPQRSPDRAKSIARRRQLAASGPMPPALASSFTTSELSVLKIVADEVAAHGTCTRTIGEIAARAGVCRTSALNALRQAVSQGLIRIEERRREGQRNLPNVITITSADWTAWLDRGGRVQKSAPHGYPSISKGAGRPIDTANRHKTEMKAPLRSPPADARSRCLIV